MLDMGAQLLNIMDLCNTGGLVEKIQFHNMGL